MPATSVKQMWFHSSTNGVAPVAERGLIAATQTILMPGAPLYLSTSGTWKVCDTTDGSDLWSGFLVGLQDKSQTWPLTAQQDGNTKIFVARISAKHRYCVFAEDNGSDASPAQDNIGNQYGLVVSTTTSERGYTTADFNEETNVGVEVVDIMSNLEPSKYSTADSPGVALVRFLDAVLETEKA
jgi:hypothetical protein